MAAGGLDIVLEPLERTTAEKAQREVVEVVVVSPLTPSTSPPAPEIHPRLHLSLLLSRSLFISPVYFTSIVQVELLLLAENSSWTR